MNQVAKLEQNALVAAPPEEGRMAVAKITAHTKMVREVMANLMKPNIHYGVIKGTPKPTLYKPGAEMLCMAFHIAPSYRTEDISTADAVRYRSTCTGTHQQTGVVLGEGQGEASSSETKYKWRAAVCEEEFNDTPDHLRRLKWNKGWNDKPAHSVKQVRTEPDDAANTVLKMANKRALIAMVLNVLAASDAFAQDLDDMSKELRDHLIKEEGDDSGGGGNGSTAGTLPPVPTEEFDASLPAWRLKIKKGQRTVEDLVTALAARKKYQFSAEQLSALKAPFEDAKDAPKAQEGEHIPATKTPPPVDAAAAPEIVDAMVKKAAEATISTAEVCKHLGVASLAGLTRAQVDSALAFIDDPMGG